MLLIIKDPNGNPLYNDKKMCDYTTYESLDSANKTLSRLPEGYYAYNLQTKKKEVIHHD
jgi:hypothetical protein